MTSPHRLWPSTHGRTVQVPEAATPPPGRIPAASANRWALLQARDIMRKDVTTVAPDSPLSEVERILSDRGIGGAPVMAASGEVLGIVSLRDLMERYAEDPDSRPHKGREIDPFPLEDDGAGDEDSIGRLFASTDLDAQETAADVMTAEVHWVSGDADLGEIARTMARHRIHRVLVRDEGRYVGLVSTLDVLDALAG